MPAALAHPHRARPVLGLVLLRRKNLDEQRRNRKDQPLDGHPPEANKHPPENAMMLRFQLCLVDDLCVDVHAPTFRTVHDDAPPCV